MYLLNSYESNLRTLQDNFVKLKNDNSFKKKLHKTYIYKF